MCRHDWNNDSFTTKLRDALANHAIDLPSSYGLTVAAGQMYHLHPLDQFIEIYGILEQAPSTTLIVKKWYPATVPAIVTVPLDDAAKRMYVSFNAA